MDTIEPTFRSRSPDPIGPPVIDDPTFAIRRNQANLCEAVMMRVVELEREAASLTEIAKKLRAAVMANT
jgi:hypothetical protein